ncbi:DUF1707 domain-containing protein [Streptomyces sp. AP-93]|uniref:DUF1707 SHOCT-like domain-containing protein n=1 Tax=Streptomyces sp. AP-93 TaxID=2929048 RepID=UPI001FAFC239|nr:DUF1707 domain-containing protein [Streptomyces sp. AP-93]MCJ0872213.1 DUF1707 domain-containing protein [Streptomyces sp. AP-93]
MSDERPEKPVPEKSRSERSEESLPEAALPETVLPETALPGGPSQAPLPASASAAAPLPELRASDADRERVVDRLRDAVAEGRLDMDEFEERLDAAYRSRTYAELEPLTRDLPALGATAPIAAAPVAPVGLTKAVPAGSETPWPARIVGGGAAGGPAVAVAVMSGFQRKGNWTVPARFHAVAFWGGGELDLREASFAEREVVINCVAIMGGIQIIVPPGVELDVRGIGVMGGFDQTDSPGPVEPGAPRVVVTGLAFWGGVEVKVKPPKQQRAVSQQKPRKEL